MLYNECLSQGRGRARGGGLGVSSTRDHINSAVKHSEPEHIFFTYSVSLILVKPFKWQCA